MSTGPAQSATTRAGLERALAARIRVGYFRALALARLRILVPLATPLWLHLRGLRLPGGLAWVLVLLTGGVLAEAVAWGLLEHVSARQAGPDASHIHLAWTFWDTTRAALLWSEAALTLLPLACTACSVQEPEGVCRSAGLVWLALVVATATLESLPPLVRALVPRAPAGG